MPPASGALIRPSVLKSTGSSAGFLLVSVQWWCCTVLKSLQYSHSSSLHLFLHLQGQEQFQDGSSAHKKHFKGKSLRMNHPFNFVTFWNEGTLEKKPEDKSSKQSCEKSLEISICLSITLYSMAIVFLPWSTTHLWEFLSQSLWKWNKKIEGFE